MTGQVACQTSAENEGKEFQLAGWHGACLWIRLYPSYYPSYAGS